MLAQGITTFCNDLGVDPASLNDGGGVYVYMCACVHLGSRHRRAGHLPLAIFLPHPVICIQLGLPFLIL